eukprot:GILJ01004217.1.p1 GENE.GILJ01004217.1~~GILJ01004217.1.p1  ORF type:complete len:463 (-),score=42.06 GILJ01004217.1:490-1878(-)
MSSTPLVLVSSLRRSAVPQCADTEHVFPKWLLERADYQQTVSGISVERKIAWIAKKRVEERSRFDIQTIRDWMEQHHVAPNLTRDFKHLAATVATAREVPANSDVYAENEQIQSMFILLSGGLRVTDSTGRCALLKPGHYFGCDVTEESDQPVVAGEKVTATSSSTLLEVTESDYKQFVLRYKMRNQSELISLLHKVSILTHCTRTKVRHMASFMSQRTCSKGDIILRKREPVRAVYFIVRGCVAVTFESHETIHKRIPNATGAWVSTQREHVTVLPLYRLEAPAFFGCEALMHSHAKFVSQITVAVDTEDTLILALPHKHWACLLNDRELIHSLKQHFENQEPLSVLVRASSRSQQLNSAKEKSKKELVASIPRLKRRIDRLTHETLLAQLSCRGPTTSSTVNRVTPDTFVTRNTRNTRSTNCTPRIQSSCAVDAPTTTVTLPRPESAPVFGRRTPRWESM